MSVPCACRGHGCVRCLAAHPPGSTCADCYAVRWCRVVIGITGAETHCDWIPSRFREGSGASPRTLTTNAETAGGVPGPIPPID